MRRYLNTVALFLCACLTGTLSAQNPTVCRLGFSYEISISPHWGMNKPVITGVYPYSSAEQMGLKQNDIIESIEGFAVTDIPVGEIPAMLNPSGKNSVTLTISNLTTTNRSVVVNKECKRQNTITEDQIAAAFSMYSLETTSEREFVCPFRTTVTNDSVDFALFRTFAFTTIDENNRELEETVNEEIRKTLESKGLIYNTEHPDMLVHTYYFFDKNPHFVGKNKVSINREPVYRYDFSTSLMEKVPFMRMGAVEAEAEFLLQFGLRFTDQHYRKGRIIWECEANELLENAYRIGNYATLHIPLMCMQYPYVKYERNVQFRVSRKIYNYTGLSYNINRMDLVSGVDRNSEAYAAGIRPNDIIESIDGKPVHYSADELSASYRQFITHTMKYRDTETLFTDANGFSNCMYWKKEDYARVAAAFRNPKNMTVFSYLYKFAPYIDPSATKTCTFQITRGKNKMEKVIHPVVRTETIVRIK